jgi:hypothetical protein
VGVDYGGMPLAKQLTMNEDSETIYTVLYAESLQICIIKM